MSSFEFVFGMISVITSLALTRLLSGCVGLYRHAEKIRFSWRHGCWTATAFMLLVANWARFWGMRNTAVWGPLDVLEPLVFVGVLYAFCDLVMPDEPKEGQVLDLRHYHALQGRRYKLMHLAFAILALLVIARRSTDFSTWLSTASFGLVAAGWTVIALWTRRTWLDTVAAVALVAMAPVFLWVNLSGLSA